jgi:hypothetical protein
MAFVFIGSLIGDTQESLEQAMATAGMLSLVGALGGFVLAMVNSFKKVVSPALVLAYAAIEGLFVGAFSWFVSVQFAGGQLDLVFGAVLGTLAALGGTLAAYKFFNIQVGARFRKIVIASMFGFVAVSLLDLVLSFFGNSFGFNGFGPMGLISSFIGVIIAVFMLILDFDFVERGIAAGLPERGRRDAVLVALLRQLDDVAGLDDVEAAVGRCDLVEHVRRLLDDDALPDAAVGGLDHVEKLGGADIGFGDVVGEGRGGEANEEQEAELGHGRDSFVGCPTNPGLSGMSQKIDCAR